MRVMSLAAACLILAGCAKEEVKTVEAPPPPSDLTREDCYTVVLFDDPKVIEPGPEVPPLHRAFAGSWTNGAWNGEWCHDVLVREVRADGSVELFEMHAPHEEWGQPATAFRRTGRIDQDGNLRFRYGTESVSYQIVEGALHARRSGKFGDLEAILIDPDSLAPVEVAAAAPAD